MAFGAGVLIAAVAYELALEAFTYGGRLAGVVTSAGFAIAFLISTME